MVVVMKVYSKNPMGLNALESQLIARGLVDGNRKLRHALETVGYFRLTGYLYPFSKPNSDDYKSGTTFERIWSIYTFDRKLRLMTADALARIEVAVRSLIVTSHTAAFPNDAFAYIDHKSLPGLKVRKHTELLNSISAAMGHAKGEPDLKHLKTKYDIEYYPPIWNVMEHAPFGIVTLFYEGLDATVKQSVANAFFMTPNAFSGVLMAMKVARNTCAHHSRFWNKHIRARLSGTLGQRKELDALHECLGKQPNRNVFTSVFAILSICAHCIQYVHPQSKWRERCRTLLQSADTFVLTGMGFPADWQKLVLWRP